MNYRTTSIPALRILIGACLMVGTGAALADEFAIRNGDRVVIYGDSITAGAEYQGYPRYIEAYIRTRYPAWTTRVWNRGMSGDTAGNLTRFKRDCLSLKPDVILFNMGMNDGGYSPGIAPGLHHYVTNITAIVAAAREANPKVRFVLISAILYESRAPGAGTSYAYVLRSYAREERELARRLNVAYIDLDRKYGETVGLAEGLFPGSIVFSGDGIHPLPNGGLLFMADYILKGLGAGGTDLVSLHVDAAAGKVVSASGVTAEIARGQEGTVSFDRTLAALPFPVVETAGGVTYRDRAVAFLVEVADELNRDMLKVTGLPAPAYALRIDDKAVAELSADELAEGVNLSRFFHTPDQDQAVAVSEAVGRAQIAEQKLWHSSASGKDGAPAADTNDDVEKAIAALRKISQPARHRFTLTPLDHAVDRYQSYEQILQISEPGTLAAGEDGTLHQDITVTVKNLSPFPRHVEFTWDRAGATPAAAVMDLAAGEKKEVPFALAVAAGDPMPQLFVKHQPADLSFPPLAQVYAPVRIPRLNVPRIPAAVKVDGVLEEWKGPAQIDFETCMTPEMRHHRAGLGDFSAQAHVGWSADCLAVGIAVQDQDHVSHFTDDRFGWDDSATVTVGDKSYTLALTSKGPMIQPEDAMTNGVAFTVKRQDLSTIYELTIPAKVIAGKNLEAGASYSFDITICDRDRDESHKEVNWCGSIANRQPGKIRLVDRPSDGK